MFFYEKLNDEIAARNIALTKEKWFTNLTSVGNIGSAAIYVGLEELIRTKEIKTWKQDTSSCTGKWKVLVWNSASICMIVSLCIYESPLQGVCKKQKRTE